MTPATVTAQDLIDFVAHEARLLDERRFDAWDALFTDDAIYWLPANPANTDPLQQASHLFDDRLLRSVKLQRLQSPRAFSQQPAGRCHHLLQASSVLAMDAGANRFELRTPFIYTELRGGHTVVLPGTAWHRLTVIDGALRLAAKRVDLLHADTALPAIEFYL